MSRLFFILNLVFILGSLVSGAQSAKSPLSRVINVSGATQIAPSLSGDGRHMVFTSTSNLKSELLLFYSHQVQPGKWTQPEPVTVVNRSLPINHIGGYSLSYDGNYIFFTSRKTYGIGQYDIWYCQRTGNNQWSEPVNLAKPVNSSLNDGCPSPSPDGKTLYFVRCQTMDLKEGTGCKLMVAEKRNQELWEEPVELPNYINDGNIMSPRILADNQTLIYAKGQGEDWDLFQTRRTSGTWSKPVALDYVNTPADERFASVPAQGDVLYYSAMFKGTYDIIKARIPEEFQPLKVVYLKGKVEDQSGSPVDGFVQIYELESKKLVQYARTTEKNNEFEFYLAAGKRYDFSIVPKSPGLAFYSEHFDLTEMEASLRRSMMVQLEPLTEGVVFPMKCLTFDNDSTLSIDSRFEMSRLIKLLKNNPGTKVEIAVHRGYQSMDSLMLLDSVPQEEPIVTESSLAVIEPTEIDSVTMEPEIVEPAPDPTELQAVAISAYLEERGVPDYIVQTRGYADTQAIVPPDAPEEQQRLNRRIEVVVQ